MKYFLFMSFLLGCSLMNHKNAFVINDIKKNGILRVGTTGDYPPFSFYNKKTKKYEGTDIELAKKLAQKLDVKLKLVKTSWPTLMNDYLNQKFEIALSGISKTKERQKVAMFSEGYFVNGKMPITLCKNKAKYKTLSDIDKKGVKLIVNPGGTNDKFARTNIENAQIIQHEDNTSIFQEIINGKADLMITDSVEVKYQTKKHSALCATTQKSFTRTEIAALIAQDHEWQEYVNSFLSQ